ncbi:hypothetical protein MIR68_010417 [Amoeboaphelidium protococcarum]|nr:hypothetical protein MIR68_010417 [Amoeboaphelidium protococcarum]
MTVYTNSQQSSSTIVKGSSTQRKRIRKVCKVFIHDVQRPPKQQNSRVQQNIADQKLKLQLVDKCIQTSESSIFQEQQKSDGKRTSKTGQSPVHTQTEAIGNAFNDFLARRKLSTSVFAAATTGDQENVYVKDVADQQSKSTIQAQNDYIAPVESFDQQNISADTDSQQSSGINDFLRGNVNDIDQVIADSRCKRKEEEMMLGIKYRAMKEQISIQVKQARSELRKLDKMSSTMKEDSGMIEKRRNLQELERSLLTQLAAEDSAFKFQKQKLRSQYLADQKQLQRQKLELKLKRLQEERNSSQITGDEKTQSEGSSFIDDQSIMILKQKIEALRVQKSQHKSPVSGNKVPEAQSQEKQRRQPEQFGIQAELKRISDILDRIYREELPGQHQKINDTISSILSDTSSVSIDQSSILNSLSLSSFIQSNDSLDRVTQKVVEKINKVSQNIVHQPESSESSAASSSAADLTIDRPEYTVVATDNKSESIKVDEQVLDSVLVLQQQEQAVEELGQPDQQVIAALEDEKSQSELIESSIQEYLEQSQVDIDTLSSSSLVKEDIVEKQLDVVEVPAFKLEDSLDMVSSTTDMAVLVPDYKLQLEQTQQIVIEEVIDSVVSQVVGQQQSTPIVNQSVSSRSWNEQIMDLTDIILSGIQIVDEKLQINGNIEKITSYSAELKILVQDLIMDAYDKIQLKSAHKPRLLVGKQNVSGVRQQLRKEVSLYLQYFSKNGENMDSLLTEEIQLEELSWVKRHDLVPQVQLRLEQSILSELLLETTVYYHSTFDR